MAKISSLKKINLFLVKSPLQLLNANEAKSYFETTNNWLIISYERSGSGAKQMEKIVAKQVWDHVVIIKSFTIFQTFRHFWMIRMFKKSKWHIEGIYFGDMRMTNFLLYPMNLSHENLFLLDDGAATIDMYSNYLLKGEFPKVGQFDLWIRTMILRFYGLSYINRISINIFTMFELSNSDQLEIVQNELVELRKYQKSFETKHPVAIIIGAKFVEMKFYRLEQYIQMIESIVSKAPLESYLYFPHRGEKQSTLDAVASLPNIQIVQVDLPVELELIGSDMRVVSVSGFVSTALLTLSKLYPEAKVVAYRDEWLQQSYQNIYKVYASQGVDIAQI